MVYDAEVDTGVVSAEECARTIAPYLDGGAEPFAIAKLASTVASAGSSLTARWLDRNDAPLLVVVPVRRTELR